MTRAEILDLLDGHHPKHGAVVAWGMNLLIILSAIAIAWETVESKHPFLQRALFSFEVLLLVIFTAEYLLRLYCAPYRWKYVFSFWGIVDLLAILPAIAMLTPQWQVVRTFRLLRLIRLLKLFRTSHAMERLMFAFKEVRGELMVFAIIAGLMLYVSAVGIYIFEHEAQPDAFTSIPVSLWWAVASFTTVGYGDLYPITTGGRIFTTFVLFLGLGIIAVPSAIITTALLESETNIQKRTAQDAASANIKTADAEDNEAAKSTKGV